MTLCKILVVDDSEPFRQFICKTLQQAAAYEVVEASDGMESVQKAEAFQPDFILMDLGLPKMNGIEAARRIQSLSSTDLLFVSQESDSDVIEAALRVPSRGFIHKLRVHACLLPAIEAVLEARPANRRNHELQSDTSETRHRHEALFYPDDSVLLDCMDRFIAAALRDGDAAIVLATEPHRAAIDHRLKQGGIDVDAAIQRGTYVPLDAVEVLSTIMVDGQPDCDRFLSGLSGLIDSAATATRRERPRVAIFGECVALLNADGNPQAAIRIEQTASCLLKERSTPVLDIICAYPLPPFGRDPSFKDICREHSAISVR